MNKQELKNLLESALVGTDFDPHANAHEIAKRVKELYPQYAGDIWTSENAKENTCYVTYKRHWLIGWKETKQQGDYRGAGHYHWIIKSITLFDWFEDDLQERFDEIEKSIALCEETKQKVQAERVENFKRIRALFPGLVWWEFSQLLEGVKSIAYEEIKKESEGL